MKMMNGRATLEYLLNEVRQNKRLVISRYGDGEYFLMTGKKESGKETFETGDMLRKALSKENQFICTAHFRATYEELLNVSTRWGNTQRYMMENSPGDLFGSGAFLRRDYMSNCKLIPYFFKGRVLIVTGHHKIVQEVFEKEKVKVDVYGMPISKASSKYQKCKNYLIKNGKKYNNILFSCGPIGKVLISDLIDECDTNLIDFGSLINVILSKYYPDLRSIWTISWAKNINVNKCANEFFNALRKIQ